MRFVCPLLAALSLIGSSAAAYKPATGEQFSIRDAEIQGQYLQSVLIHAQHQLDQQKASVQDTRDELQRVRRLHRALLESFLLQPRRCAATTNYVRIIGADLDQAIAATERVGMLKRTMHVIADFYMFDFFLHGECARS